ncbi:MAG TPA: glycine cleavage system protein GcvH [Thermoguttaceae bacterium]|nr:glycine cleavage system protein GcvH [Thermoguttaceae bacterium]
MTPEQLLYAKTHEWVHVETDPSGAKIATVGLSAFALEVLTDLVYIELPEVGRQVEAGASFGEIESVKAVSDLFSPVDGEIVEVNPDAADGLDRLADDPYGAGWLVKIKITDESGLSELLDYAAYRKQCEEEMEEQG